MQQSAHSISRETLLRFLNQIPIAYQEQQHAAVFTMEQSAALDFSHLQGCRCKSLLVSDRKKSTYLLIVTLPDSQVDLGALGRSLGVGRLSLCPPDLLLELLGVSPGAVSPLALLTDQHARRVRLYIDMQLKTADHFLFHPLVNTSTLSMSREAFLGFLESIQHSAEFVSIPVRSSNPQSL